MHTTIPPLMTPKNRSNGASLTSMDSTSTRRQVTVISELTPPESLLLQELGWNQSKVEELLLPIIQKIRKRSQVGFFPSHVEIKKLISDVRTSPPPDNLGASPKQARKLEGILWRQFGRSACPPKAPDLREQAFAAGGRRFS